MSICRLQKEQVYRPGSLVPGPPPIPIRMGPPLGGGATLMVATSKDGCPSGVCAYASPHASEIRTIAASLILNLTVSCVAIDWSGADALVRAGPPVRLFGRRTIADEGVGCGPGGPPHALAGRPRLLTQTT